MAMMDLANEIYKYELAIGENQPAKATALCEAIMTKIKTDNMSVLYITLVEKFSWSIDNELLDSMK